jgi:uncharacterized membrane protein YdjX (TVP38/TMEM64 family)
MPAALAPGRETDPIVARRLWPWALASAVALVVLAWQGHHLAHLLPGLEKWLEELGPWAPLVFMFGAALLLPFFIPDSLFGIAAGVAFGAAEGIAVYFGANVVAAILIYSAARSVLRSPVTRALAHNPRLRAIQRGARKDATRVSLLVRMLPVNVALISYTLSAAGVSFRPYLIGSIGMLPHLSITVLLGDAASRVTRIAGQGHRAWTVEAAASLAGLAVAWIVLGYLVRLAKRALAELDSDSSDDPPPGQNPAS